MNEQAAKTRKPLVKKGGTRYPKYRLEDALLWSKKLVSRTHTAPQPQDVIFAAVVESRGSTADIKVSALRQYGLLDGKSSAYIATDLAKKIAHAPPEEVHEFYKQAALTPPIFRGLYDTFGASEVTKSQLKRRAADLNVHPDSLDECVEMYVSSLSAAGLARLDGDRVIQGELPVLPPENNSENPESPEEEDNTEVGAEVMAATLPTSRGRSGKSSVNVTVNLDSSLDPEKLEKQLALLKRYGAI